MRAHSTIYQLEDVVVQTVHIGETLKPSFHSWFPIADQNFVFGAYSANSLCTAVCICNLNSWQVIGPSMSESHTNEFNCNCLAYVIPYILDAVINTIAAGHMLNVRFHTA